MDKNRIVVYECKHIDYPNPAWVWVPEYDKMAVESNLYGYEAYHYPLGTRITVTITIEEPDAQPAPRMDEHPLKLANEQNGE